MKSYIIKDLAVIKKITGKDYQKIIVHINLKDKTAKYETDHTLFELTETVDYHKVEFLLDNK